MQAIEQIDSKIKSLEKKLEEVKGTKTEVYTRIVGYHRAVDNWNKGKKEEYKNRHEYKFDTIKVSERSMFALPEKESKINIDNLSLPEYFNVDDVAFYKLFTSQFCRNCPPVKEYVNTLHIVGEEVDVSTDLGINASRKYNILSTPTVILFDSNDNILYKAYSVEELKNIFSKIKELV